MRMDLKRKLIKYGVLVFACLCVMFASAPKVLADSVIIDIIAENEEVTVGQLVEVNLVLKSGVRLGGFESYLTYNAATLEFQSADDGISGGDGILRIYDPEPSLRSKERTYRIIFKAIEVGGSELAFKGNVYVYDDDTDEELSVSSSSLSISIKPEEVTSTENRLSGLIISPGNLNPLFDPETTSYTTEVSDKVNELVISATPMDATAKVTVSGNEEFTSGENKVIITVKAASSDEKTYTIIVNKTEDVKEEPETEQIDLTEILANEFSVIGQGGNFILTGRYNYTVTHVADIKDVPEGYESYTLELYGKKIPAYKKTDETSPEVVLLYVINGGDGCFYEFNIEKKTMDRIKFETVTKEVEKTVIPEDIIKADNKVLYGIIAVLFILCALLGIALINAAGDSKNAKRRSQSSGSTGSRSSGTRSSGTRSGGMRSSQNTRRTR